MKKIIKGFSIATLSIFMSAVSVFAADPKLSIERPADYVKVTNIGTLIKGGLAFAMIAAALVAFVYLLWGGFQWITSGGDKAAVEAARLRISAALVGLVIIAAAWAIMLMIQYFFGIKIFGEEDIFLPKGY